MIWIVIEHEDTRSKVASLIRGKSYAAAEMDCGDEVVKRLQFQLPVLIILDCGVAGIFDMLLAIRTIPRAASVPVVMFSRDDQNLQDKCLMAGANAYVPKGSLDWAELLEEVVRFAGAPGQ